MKSEIKNLIAKGLINESIEEIKLIVSKQDSFNLYNRIILISSKFSKLREEYRLGTLLYDEYNKEYSKIVYGLLEEIDKIEISDDNEDVDIDNKKYIDFFNSIISFNNKVVDYSSTTNTENDKRILNINLKNSKTSLSAYNNAMKQWADIISFKDLKDKKHTANIYVELDYYLMPRRMHIEDDTESIELNNIFLYSSDHIILFGQPGAGKTTTVKKLTQLVLSQNDRNVVNFDEVLTIRLRELNSTGYYLLEYIYCEIFGFRINNIDLFKSNQSFYISTLSKLLNSLRYLVILDGFDEINSNRKRQVIREVELISINLTSSRIVITSRSGELDYEIPKFKEFEIKSLSELQIKNFVENWLIDSEKVSMFLSQIKSSPFFDTINRPLTLAHLCAIFDRYRKIPDKPKTVYKKIINLMLEEWDTQRGVHRDSEYSNFEVDRKFEFLSNLSFELTTVSEKFVFSRSDLRKTYINICDNFNLPKYEDKKVVNELETHTGIILQSGYDRFEFSHKSIQEYLSAEYMVRLPSIPQFGERLILPNETALCLSLSADPNYYFSSLIFKKLFKHKHDNNFINIFFNRLQIEKPDFYPDILLGISFYSLFSKLYSETSKKRATTKEFKSYAESIKAIFESTFFLKEYFIEASYSLADIIYEAKDHYESAADKFANSVENYDKNELVLLKQRKNLQKSYEFSLPKFLLIHKEYWEYWG